MPEQWVLALALTCLAGLSTGIGGLISLFAKRDNRRFLAVALGFSAGMMIYVSLVELFPEAMRQLESVSPEHGRWLPHVGFFGGIAVIALIDFLVPEKENPHHVQEAGDSAKLSKAGIMTMLAVAIHNFPEGLATFASVLQDASLGRAVTIAVALHNIPEGIAVALPIFYATRNRRRAVALSFASGLAEPIGALLGIWVLAPFLNDTLFGVLMAAVSGIMIFISIDELLPTARSYGEAHLSMVGLIAGMVIMAASLILF